MRRRALPVAALAVIALGLVGCSSSDDDSTDKESDKSTTTTADEKSTTTAGEDEAEDEDAEDDATTTTEAEDTDDADQAAAEEALAELLVTPEDLGEGFTEGPYDPAEGGPCGTDPDDDFPPLFRNGRAMLNEEAQLGMLHELRVYDTDATASSAFEAATVAVGCGEDTVDGILALGDVTDISAEMGTDAFAVEISGGDIEGVMIVALYSDLLSVYQFQGAPGAAEAANAPNPLDIAQANMGTVVETIG